MLYFRADYEIEMIINRLNIIEMINFEYRIGKAWNKALVIRRLLFLFLSWLPLVNICITTLFILIPYWLLTGKIAYECKYFVAINEWHWNLKKQMFKLR